MFDFLSPHTQFLKIIMIIKQAIKKERKKKILRIRR